MNGERAAIRVRIRDTLLDMSTAERNGNDQEALVLAEAIVQDAKALRNHFEDHGL